MTIQWASAPRGGFAEADAFGRGGPCGRIPLLVVEGAGVAVLDAGQQVAVKLLGPIGHQGRLQAARGRAAQGREQGGDRHLELLERHVHDFLHVGPAGGVADEHARQRPDFDGLAFPAGRLEPGILGIQIEPLVGGLGARVMQIGDAAPGMQAGVVVPRILVPGMRDELLDLLRVAPVHLMHLRQVAVQDCPAGELELARIANPVRRQVAVAQVIGQTAAHRAPIFVERGDGQQVRDVHLIDEGLGLVQQGADIGQSLGVDRVGIVDVDGAGNTAHEVIWMRVLAAEDGVNLDDFLLPFQGLEVVGHGQEIDRGRQLVGRTAPVTVGKDAQLPAADKGLEARLDVGEVFRRTLRPGRNAACDLRGVLGIGLERADHVHPVQGVQMIEMHDVILHELGAEHEVADQFRIGWDDDVQRVLDGAHGGQRMHGGADAAGALGKGPRVARIASL